MILNDDYEIAPTEWIEAANAYAGAATRAWLAGLGLAANIAALLEDSEDPVEIPPLDPIVEELGESCLNACKAADFITSTLATEYDQEELLPVIQSLGPVEINALATQRAMARIAEIVLGIINRSEATDEMARAERAAVVAVLTHPGSSRIENEVVAVAATTYEALTTELTGTIERMSLDPEPSLRLSPKGQPELSITYSVSESGDLEARLSTPSPDAKVLSNIGWDHTDSQSSFRWEDPVMSLDPALLAIDTINQVWLLTEPLNIEITALS